MYKKLLLTAATIGLCLPLLAQEGFQQPDSVQLHEVVVYGIPLQKFTSGTKIVVFDSASIARKQSRSLSEFLIRKSPVYFKEYGPGMLSTISFRGTAPNHTAVLWNGLNLNQPNLGQTDFSLLPLFALEKVAVQYGGSSALWGSDAIGGAIHLGSEPQWTEGLHLKIQQEAGSFGHYFTGLAAEAGFGKWWLSSKGYSKQAENDFEYINPNKKNRPVERNRNARFEQKGLVQEAAYRFSGSTSLSFKGWYQHTYRQLQPGMGDRQTQDQQEDENLNLSLEYKNNSPSGFFDVQLGHLHNYLRYNRGSEYKTWQTISKARYERSLGEQVHFQLGAKFNHIQAHIDQYPGGEAEENRSDFFASVRYQPLAQLEASLNLRQPVVSGFTVPFTPSAGLEYSLLRKNHHQLQWLASGGRSFRVPTLNDRYWQYAGNPELRPESSWNGETTLKYQYNVRQSTLELSTTAYAMWVDNWIIWLPGTVAGPEGEPFNTWAPQNIQEVHSRGLEALLELTQALPLGVLNLNGSLAYTRSINKKAKHEYDRTVNKQLPFVPLFKGNAFLSYSLKDWFLSASWNSTGIRYTSGEESPYYSLPAYSLFDASIGKSFSWRKHTLSLSLDSRNLGNTQYQNYANRAMPGRNYMLSLKCFLNHPL